jgi:hypothetical protein
MSDSLKAQLEISADASGVEAGVSKAKRSLADLGAAAATAGKAGADGFEQIADSVAKLPFTTDKATKDLAQQIQRATAAMSAGAKGTTEYYAALANTRGANLQTLKPFLDQLSEAAAKTKLAAEANKKLEESTRFLETLKGRSDAIGKTASELAALRAAQLGVSDAAAPMIAKLREQEKASNSVKDSVAKLARDTIALGAAYLSVAAIISRLNAAIDGLATLDDLSQKTGSSVENLSRLAKVSVAFGHSLDEVDGALSKLARGMSGLDDDSNKVNKALTALGISSKDAFGRMRDPSEVMVEISQRLQNFKDGAGKTAIAMDLFGKSGANLLPYLNDLADNVDKFSTVSTEAAKRASELQDRMGILKVKSGELWTSLATYLVPALTDFAGAMLDAKTEVKGLTANDELGAWATGLVDTFVTLTNAVSNLHTQLSMVGTFAAHQTAGSEINKKYDQMLLNAPPKATMGGALEQARNIERQRQDEFKREADLYEKTQVELAGRIDSVWKAYEQKRSTRKAQEAVDSDPEIKRLKARAEALKGQLNYTSGNEKEVKEKLSDYEKLIRTVNEKIAVEAAEAFSTSKLTEGEKLRAKLLADLATGAAKLTEKEKERALATLAVLDTVGKSKAASEEIKKLYEAHNDAAKKAVENAVKEAETNERLAHTYGMTRGEIEALELARLQDQLAQRASLGLTIDEITQLEKLIEAKKRSAAALAQVDTKDAAKKLSDEWKKDFDRIENWIGDAIGRGITHGKDIFKSLVDGLKALFARLVLSPIINPIAAFGASFLNPGVAAAANGITEAGNSGGILAGAGALSSNFSGGMTAGFQQLTSGVNPLSFVSGTADVASNSISTAVGQVAGYLSPIVLGISALSSILKSFQGETRGGGQYGYSFDGTLTNNRRGSAVAGATAGVNLLEGPSGGEIASSQVRAAIDGAVTGINGLLKAAGSAASLSAFQAGLETSDEGRGGVFSGGKLSTGATFGESGQGDNYSGTLFERSSTQSPDAQTAVANFALDLKQATIQALQAATDLPKTIADKLAGVDAEKLTDEAATALLTTINNQVASVKAFQTAIVALPFENLKNLSFDAASGLIAAAGGLDALNANLSSYYENYFSAEEKKAELTKVLSAEFQKLGFTLPATREQFRAMIDSVKDVGTEAGNATYAGLLKLNGALNQLLPTLDEVANAAAAVKTAGDYFKDAMNSVDFNFSGLQRSVDAEKSRLDKIYAEEQKAINDRATAQRDAAQLQLDSANTSLQALQSVYSSLDSAAKAAAPMSREAAQRLLDSALQFSNAGGSLANYSGLEDAIRAVAAPSQDSFATLLDFQRDQAKTANTLESLRSNAGAQVSVGQMTVDALKETIKTIEETAKDQLKALDEQHQADIAHLDQILADGKAQIDALNGIDTSVKSLAEAMRLFAEAIAAAKANPVGAATPQIGTAYEAALGRTAQQFEIQFWQNQIANGQSAADAVKAIATSREAQIVDLYRNVLGREADAAGLRKQFESGLSIDQIKANILNSAEYQNKLPHLAVGTNYVPNDMVAKIHEGERIIPAADNRALLSALRNPSAETAEMVAELRALRAEVVELRKSNSEENYSIALHASNTADTLDRFDNAGLPATRT